jgi:hypothetical protein
MSEPVKRTAAWVPVTDEMLEDVPSAVVRHVQAAMRRLLWPSDPNPFPRFSLLRKARK